MSVFIHVWMYPGIFGLREKSFEYYFSDPFILPRNSCNVDYIFEQFFYLFYVKELRKLFEISVHLKH